MGKWKFNPMTGEPLYNKAGRRKAGRNVRKAAKKKYGFTNRLKRPGQRGYFS